MRVDIGVCCATRQGHNGVNNLSSELLFDTSMRFGIKAGPPDYLLRGAVC